MYETVRTKNEAEFSHFLMFFLNAVQQTIFVFLIWSYNSSKTIKHVRFTAYFFYTLEKTKKTCKTCYKIVNVLGDTWMNHKAQHISGDLLGYFWMKISETLDINLY
jgi:hypothetical protein